MKICKKIIAIIIIVTIMNILYPVTSSAIRDIFSSSSNFINNADTTRLENMQTGETTLQGISSLIYNMLLAIAIVLAVIIGAILGIKFMVGGLEEKANIKEALVPYIIGCIIVFGAFTIWSIVMSMRTFNGTTSRRNVANIGTSSYSQLSF